MKHTIYHGLEFDLAKKVSQKAIQAYSSKYSKYNPKFSWVSDSKGEISFKARGISISGTVEIVGPNIILRMDVPFLVRAFAGSAKNAIDAEVQKWVLAVKEGKLKL